MLRDDEELEMLRRRMMERVKAQELAQDQTPNGDFGMRLALGGVDLANNINNGSLDHVETLTGLKLSKPNGKTDNLDNYAKAQATRATATRQKALDDMTSMSSIQKLIDARQEKEEAAKTRAQTLDMGGWAIGPDSKMVRVSGGAADIANQEKLAGIQKSLAEAKAAPGLAALKNRLTEAKIESLGANAALKEMTAAKGPVYNKDQNDAGGYARRLEQAESDFAKLATAGYDRTNNWESVKANAWGPLQGENAKLQNQAERNFINANLRRESGAAISPTEFDSAAQQYFPRAGDTPAVLEQKMANRQQVIANLKAASSGAIDKIPLVGAQPPSAKPPTGIKIGMIEDGHMYLGGNPADPKSWRQQ